MHGIQFAAKVVEASHAVASRSEGTAPPAQKQLQNSRGATFERATTFCLEDDYACFGRIDNMANDKNADNILAAVDTKLQSFKALQMPRAEVGLGKIVTVRKPTWNVFQR